jgi:hypothetical protein
MISVLSAPCNHAGTTSENFPLVPVAVGDPFAVTRTFAVVVSGPGAVHAKLSVFGERQRDRHNESEQRATHR